MNRPAGGTGTMIKSPVEGKEANSIAGRTQDHNGSHLNLRCVLAQHSDEQRCRIGRHQPMRAEQNHAGRTAARKREDAAEVEIMGQDNEPGLRAHWQTSRSEVAPSPTALQCSFMPASSNASTQRGDRFMSTRSFNSNRPRLPAPRCPTRPRRALD